MNKHTWWKVGAVLAASMFLFGACSSDDDGGSLTVIGTSGAEVSMDGAWSRGCTIDGTESELNTVTVSGTSFTNSEEFYGTVTDCSTASDFTFVFTATVTGNATVTITGWTNFDGSDTTAPTGLDAVTTANGVTVKIKTITGTPNTADGAMFANTDVEDGVVGFCGFTDWAAGVSKDLLDCFTGGGAVSFPESWVVDDSAATLAWYTGEDEAVADASGFPTVIDNFDPNLK